MKRIKVIKNGAITNQAEFEDPTKWLEKHIAKNTFGKPERWVTQEQEDVSSAIETREVEVTPVVLDEQGEVIEPAVMVTEYKLAAEYEIIIDDISEEIKAREQKEKVKAETQARLEALDVKARLSNATNVAALRSAIQDILMDLVELRKK